MYDVIIIGAGAAGITAAIYAARANLSFEIISKDVGGLTLWSSDIENYTGYHNLNGIELVEKFKEHMADYNINVKEETATKVEKTENFLVKTDKGEYETKTVIIASGSSPRKLEVPGADNYEGKGLVYCATCDGPLFAGRDVVVIGGGDAATDAANTLLNMGINKIYILNLNPELTGTDNALKEKVTSNEKVEVINNSATKEIFGDEFVKGIKYEQDNQEKQLDVEGVFIEIGHIRNTDIVKDLVKLNEKNEIVVNKTGASSTPGIFAAGDVTDLPGKQSIIAAGDGSRALLSAFGYITKK
ncbi:FAD-dependent oxidoreductase [Candidatus Woesearchaeota archaeon]|nr:FAD-dependent oxidoreductase [Candidatus Woesearchaeota archaeon]